MSQIFLFLITRDEVVAICPAVSERLLAVQHTVLARDHDLVKLAEQRHQFGNTQLFRINTNGTAGNAVIAGAIIRLPDKIHFE